jgi:hypothetical protein
VIDAVPERGHLLLHFVFKLRFAVRAGLARSDVLSLHFAECVGGALVLATRAVVGHITMKK